MQRHKNTYISISSQNLMCSQLFYRCIASCTGMSMLWYKYLTLSCHILPLMLVEMQNSSKRDNSTNTSTNQEPALDLVWGNRNKWCYCKCTFEYEVGKFQILRHLKIVYCWIKFVIWLTCVWHFKLDAKLHHKAFKLILVWLKRETWKGIVSAL